MQETAKGTTGWTVETLMVHVSAMIDAQDRRNQQRFDDHEKAVDKALSSAEKAVEKAEMNAEKWRANANEWRGAMGDRERTFAPVQRLEAIEKRMDGIERLAAEREGNLKGVAKGWQYLVAAVVLVGAVIGIIATLKR